jgi:hypothetical protein
MHPFPFAEPTRLCFSGDWHMNTASAVQVLANARNEGAEVVIQLGDFGVFSGPAGSHFLATVDRTAGELGLDVLFVDGNHEDFDFLESIPLAPGGYRSLGEHVFHAPRNLRWEWSGLRFCAFGGATSLDRPSRLPGVSWWPQESHTLEQLHLLTNDGQTDVLLTHDCPAGVPIPGITHRMPTPAWDPFELERAWQHRERFALAVAEVAPSLLLHGHFHRFHRSEVRCFGTTTEVIGLGDDFCDPSEQTYVVSLEELAATNASLRAR